MRRLRPECIAVLVLALGACSPPAEAETAAEVDEVPAEPEAETTGEPESAEEEAEPEPEPEPEPTPVVVEGEIGARIDEWLVRAVPFGFGGSVVVAQDGGVIVRRGYGPASRALELAIDPDTRFHLGSIGKTYTATAVLRLVAHGRLALNTRVGEVWPDAPEDKAAVTVQHLLAHTSGLPYHATDGRSTAGMTLAEVVELALAEPLAFQPGERFEYSNVGYVLLAGVVERVHREPWRDALRALVLEPAGLERTGFAGEPFDGLGVAATSYVEDQDGGRPDEWDIDAGGSGAGDLVATADDVRRFFEALVGGELLPAELLERMLTPASDTDHSFDYGYGVFLATTPRDTRVVYHDGDFMGFSGSVRVYPDEARSLVLLSNQRLHGAGLREAVTQPVALLASDVDVTAPPSTTLFDAVAAAELAGRWRTSSGATLVTAPDPHGLLVVADASESLALLSTRTPDEPEAQRWTIALQETLTAAARGDRAAVVAARTRSVVDRGLEPTIMTVLAGQANEAPIEVLGHVHHGSAGNGYSYARVGEAVVGFLWTGDGWMFADEAVSPGHSAIALATGERSFALHDLFDGGTVTLTFERDAAELRVEGPGGSATFERAP